MLFTEGPERNLEIVRRGRQWRERRKHAGSWTINLQTSTTACSFTLPRSAVISDNRGQVILPSVCRQAVRGRLQLTPTHNDYLRRERHRQWCDQFLGGREFWRRTGGVDRHFKRCLRCVRFQVQQPSAVRSLSISRA